MAVPEVRNEPGDEADLMSIGAHCSHPECNQLDFLPFRCSACRHVYCQEHRSAAAHSCTYATSESNDVIVCPICARAVKLVPGEEPEVTFERHTLTTCDPSNYEKVHKKPRCPVKNCKEKLTSINVHTCKDCDATVCLKHRLGPDHNCPGRPAAASSAGRAASIRASFGNLFNAGGFGNSAHGPIFSKARMSKTGTPSATSGQGSAAAMNAQLQQYRTAQKERLKKGSTLAPSRSAGSRTRASGNWDAATAAHDGRETCPQCGERFTTVQALIDHAASAHAGGWSSGAELAVRPPDGNSIERCPHCAADFADPVKLVDHVERFHRRESEICVVC